jgi:hypothetical protein
MVFSGNTIQLTFGRRRSPDQSATQLESNNQRSSSMSPGLSPRWYKQPYPWTQRSNTGPQPRWNPLEGSLQFDFRVACTMTSNGLAITGPQPRWLNSARLRRHYAWPEASKRLCRALADTTAITTIRQPLGPRFGYAFPLRQESSRTALLPILRPCARMQSRSW